MDYFDISRLKRDPDKIKKNLKQVGDAIVAQKRINVYFPVRFVDKGLCHLDRIVRLASYYAVVDDDGNYGIVNNPIYQHMKPSKISMVNIGKRNDRKDTYICLSFLN